MSYAKYRCKPELKGKYEVKVLSHKDVENTQGGYYEVVLDIPTYGEYKYCVFGPQVDYVTRNLNKQLGVARDKYTLEEALDLLKDNLTVWISYNENYGRYNLALHDSTLEVISEEAPDL